MSHGDYFLLYHPIKMMSTCIANLRHDIKFTRAKCILGWTKKFYLPNGKIKQMYTVITTVC